MLKPFSSMILFLILEINKLIAKVPGNEPSIVE